jgi:hypothetical protein
MLYSNKIKPYSFVNPNLISVPRSGMASAVRSGGGAFASSSKRTLLGLNRLGASLTSLGKTQSQIRDVLSIQLKTSKDVKAFKLRKAQYFRDQESERRTELAGQKKGEVVDKEEVKKEGEKKLSWLEKLLGPFKGIVEFALRTIITQGILRWISDPKNGERLQKVVSGLSKFFGFVFGIVSWSIGSFMSGISNVFGDGSKGGLSRFAEILGGLGQIIVGIAGLKAASYLLNPFSLIGDILGLLDNVSSKNTSGGDLPTDKPGKPGRAERGALTKFGRNAFVKTLGKGGAKSALTFFKKTVSPLLKKIPIIGGLIDFAINVFVFKESPGKAAFKAIGAGLLTWLGGAIGSVIPGPGTFVGALLGGMAGDALGGLLYDAIFGKSKKDDEPALAEGGLITKPTRALIGEKGPEIVIPLAMMGSMGGIGPIAGVLYSALSGALSAMGSSGELAKQVVGDDLAEMQKQAGGSRPAQPGETLGKSVVKGGSLAELELGSDPGKINQYIGDKSSYGKKSSRNTLRGALANILGIFESISKKSFSTGGGGGGGTSGGASGSDTSSSGGGSVSLEPGKWNPVLDLILKYEAGRNGLESMYPSTKLPGATKMTIAEVASRATGAVGAWQNLPEYLVGRAKAVGLNPQKDLYNLANQQKIAEYLIGPGQGGVNVDMAKNNPKQAMLRLSKVWAAIPKDDSGVSYYAGVGNNKAHIKPKQVYEAFQKLAAGGSVKSATGEGRTKGQETKGSPASHAYLDKLSDKNIKKAYAAAGLCVTGSLDTMQQSGVPNPAATGNDVGNNPRGAAVQLIKSFGWQSIGGSRTTLKSPYGTVSTGVYSKSEYAKAVDEGKVPSGALIFQTRHPDWNGTSYNSRGFDMAIAQRKGRSLWNGQALGQWVYGNTNKIIALTPGGKASDGSAPEADSSTGSTTAGGSEEKEMTPEEQLQSILKKMTKDILSLSGASEAATGTEEQKEKEKAKLSPAVKPTIIPPEPKPKVSSSSSISASSTSNDSAELEKLSVAAAAMEEDKRSKISVVPIPTAINSGSASAPTPQPPVVRARTPITYGF